MKPYHSTHLGELYLCSAFKLLDYIADNNIEINFAMFAAPFWGSTPEGDIEGFLGRERSSEDYVSNYLYAIDLIADSLTDDGIIAVISGDTWKNYSWHMIPQRISTEIYKKGYNVISTITWAKEVYDSRTDNMQGKCLRVGMPSVKNIRFRPTKDNIVIFSKDKKWYIDKNHGDLGEVWCIPDEAKPTGYGLELTPMKLVTMLLKFFCPKNGLALDPFMGTGTLATACEKLGIRWIGSEFLEKYLRISVDRLSKIGGGLYKFE